jgi:hypothetical protein
MSDLKKSIALWQVKGKVVRGAAWNGDDGFVIGFEDGDHFSIMANADEGFVSLEIHDLSMGDDDDALVAAGLFADVAAVKLAREEADAKARAARRDQVRDRDLKELTRLKALYEGEGK